MLSRRRLKRNHPLRQLSNLILKMPILYYQLLIKHPLLFKHLLILFLHRFQVPSVHLSSLIILYIFIPMFILQVLCHFLRPIELIKEAKVVIVHKLLLWQRWNIRYPNHAQLLSDIKVCSNSFPLSLLLQLGLLLHLHLFNEHLCIFMSILFLLLLLMTII